MNNLEEQLRESLKIPVDLPIRLQPQLKGSHYVSEIFLELAKIQSIDPVTIINQLNLDLSTDYYQVKIDNAYLNINLKKIVFEEDELTFVRYNQSKKIKQVVVFAEENLAAFSRVLAQALLLSRYILDGSELIIFYNDTKLLVDQQSLPEIFQQLGKVQLPSIENVITYCNKSPEIEKKLVILTASTLNKKLARELYQAVIRDQPANIQETLEINFVNELEVELLTQFTESSSHELEKLLLLATNIPGSDIYYDEATLPQKNNLLWYLQHTEKRARQLSLATKIQGLELDLSILPEKWQGLAVIVSQLNEFYLESATLGKISNFILAIRCLLDQYNAVINSPEFRKNLAQEAISPEQQEIISGATLAISSILSKVFP